MPVKQVKESAAASEHGVKGGWEVAGIKLIFQGKVLDDGKDLASYGIGEGDFMVVMASKPKKPASASGAAASTPAPVTPAAPAAPADTPAPPPAPAPPPLAPAAPRAANFSPEASAAMDNLVEMGYERGQVEAAMIAAFMNPDRAVQYLEEGIPDVAADAQSTETDRSTDDESAQAPTTWTQLAASPQFRMEIAAIRDQAQLQAYLQSLTTSDPAKLALIQANAQAFAALLNASHSNAATSPAAAGGGGAALPFGGDRPEAPPDAALPPGMQQLLANPQALEGLMQNPEMLAQLLQVPEVQQAMQNPEVMEQLGMTPEMMQMMLGGMLGGGGGGGGGGGMPNPILAQLTDEDEAAIERLMALGFPRPLVIQAFLACEKNENLAANFLFDQGADLM